MTNPSLNLMVGNVVQGAPSSYMSDGQCSTWGLLVEENLGGRGGFKKASPPKLVVKNEEK